MNIDQLIKSAIRDLSEDKKIKAKVGRGNLKTYIKAAKARSENDPAGLLKDLGVPPRFSREPKIVSLSFREKVAAFLRRSFESHEAMGPFVGVRVEQGRSEALIAIDSNLLSSRDATMFINNISI